MSAIAKIPSADGQSQENCKFCLDHEQSSWVRIRGGSRVHGQRQSLNEDEFVVYVGSYGPVM